MNLMNGVKLDELGNGGLMGNTLRNLGIDSVEQKTTAENWDWWQ